jgi:hypothetical protein
MNSAMTTPLRRRRHPQTSCHQLQARLSPRDIRHPRGPPEKGNLEPPLAAPPTRREPNHDVVEVNALTVIPPPPTDEQDGGDPVRRHLAGPASPWYQDPALGTATPPIAMDVTKRPARPWKAHRRAQHYRLRQQGHHLRAGTKPLPPSPPCCQPIPPLRVARFGEAAVAYRDCRPRERDLAAAIASRALPTEPLGGGEDCGRC